MKKHYFLFLLFFISFLGYSQKIKLSDKAEVSILTIGPGSQLYDSFGHSAFRIKDETQNIDLVYNYGTYDFDTPNFYMKFVRGKLLYKLDFNRFGPFYDYYVRQNRWITEQQLALTQDEKQELFNFLLNNAKPKNRDYLYDFLHDNCATRIRDVLVSVLGNKLKYNNQYIKNPKTFRQLIQENVAWNTWGSFGMDIAIGAIVDQKASIWEHQFLPLYVMKAADNATLNNGTNTNKLVLKTKNIFINKPQKKKTNFFVSPLFVMSILAFIILFITFKDYKNQSRSRYLDATIFFITGIIGVLLFFLWVATDHSTTTHNYNLLWAFPLSLFLSKAVAKKTPPVWIKNYIFFLLLMLVLLCIHWITQVQVFALGLIPLLFALFIRYVYLVHFYKSKK